MYLTYLHKSKQDKSFQHLYEQTLKELEVLEEPLPTEILLRMRLVISDLFYGKLDIQNEYDVSLRELQSSGSRFANFFS